MYIHPKSRRVLWLEHLSENIFFLFVSFFILYHFTDEETQVGNTCVSSSVLKVKSFFSQESQQTGFTSCNWFFMHYVFQGSVKDSCHLKRWKAILFSIIVIDCCPQNDLLWSLAPRCLVTEKTPNQTKLLSILNNTEPNRKSGHVWSVCVFEVIIPGYTDSKKFYSIKHKCQT